MFKFTVSENGSLLLETDRYQYSRAGAESPDLNLREFVTAEKEDGPYGFGGWTCHDIPAAVSGTVIVTVDREDYYTTRKFRSSGAGWAAV